ncbi:site-specific integrase [Paraburkholderia sp. MM5482-R1]|uniref:site-specific integrase n=1 Tax=Paraburkholderia sp. MM5482-R1 TaxID=2991063 RepID=UPI003D239231
MTPSDWIDMLAVPPRPLPAKLDEAVAYLSDVLHVPVYTRWTPSALLQRYGSMPAAKAALPDVFALLLAGTPVVQFWNAGQLQTLPESRAPSVDIVVHRLLQVMRVRFRRATSDASRPGGAGSANATPAARMAASDSLDGEVWLARSGHLLNRNAASNSLGVQDDASAVRTFIRDRAGASAHTRRAYVCEIRRFIRWCEDKGITGPFSGLSRDDVIRYRDQFPAAQAATRGALREPADSTRRRALAVIRSLTSYLWKTALPERQSGRRTRQHRRRAGAVFARPHPAGRCCAGH